MVNPFPLTINSMPLAKWKYSRCLMVLPGQLMSWLTASPPSEVNKGVPPPLRTKSIPAKMSCHFTHQVAVEWCHQTKKVSANRKILSIFVRKYWLVNMLFALHCFFLGRGDGVMNKHSICLSTMATSVLL